jgi:hypothetical protein
MILHKINGQHIKSSWANSCVNADLNSGLDLIAALTLLTAQEDFIAFICHESFKSYMYKMS